VGDEPSPDEIGQLIGKVALELERELDGMTADVCAQLLDQIPVLNVDGEDYSELLVASVGSNLATALDVLAHHIPASQVDAPTAAGHYARRLAQRDVPLEGLLRAYRLGEARFYQWWMRRLSAHHPEPDLLSASVQLTMATVSTYIDRVSENLTEIYAEERDLWARRAGATRAVRVQSVLFDEGMDEGSAEAILGHRMPGTHLGLVAWTRGRQTARQIESIVQAITELSGQQPLAVLVDDRTLWAWLAGTQPGQLDLARLAGQLRARGPGMRMAIGGPASGLAGFRASHLQARQAQRVAEVRGDGAGPLTVFADVAVSAFLARDLAGARRWVAGVLGGLAVADESMAELRRTVLAYLRAGSSLTEAATELHLHKNTVRYRLRKADDIRGLPIGERRLDVEVALLACEHLGTSVLVAPGPPKPT
jgi:DNA-binding PucR family transcriptional regulator